MPVYRTNNRLILPPALLGATNVALGGGFLAWRAIQGTLAADINIAGATTVALLGTFLVVVAFRLHHYRFDVTEKGLAVGAMPRGYSTLLPWGEIDRLERLADPKRGRKGFLVYHVVAGKRVVAFTSHLFPGHADLASLIAEHTDKAWTSRDR
jgi:hypothetical protein